MRQWLDLMTRIRNAGVQRLDRTGIGTRALFGEQLKLDNSLRFPAVTTKKLFMEQCMAELSAFLKGATMLEEFHKEGCTIWDANAAAPSWTNKGYAPGYVGRIYGAQWRGWIGGGKLIDQMAELIYGLKASPHSRRHVVTAYNPGELDQMCLPPCHLMFQCFVHDNTLSMMVYMRSVDVFLGLPFDIASYAVLQRLIAQTVGMKTNTLTFALGDTHLYNNHAAQVEIVLGRDPLQEPLLKLDPEATVFNFSANMVELVNYQHHGVVKAPMNV
jgi:thymidylate synthase